MAKNKTKSTLKRRQLSYEERKLADLPYAIQKMGLHPKFMGCNKFGETFWIDDQGRLFRVAYYNTGKMNQWGVVPCERSAKFMKMERSYLDKRIMGDFDEHGIENEGGNI